MARSFISHRPGSGTDVKHVFEHIENFKGNTSVFACLFLIDVHVALFALDGMDDFDELAGAECVATFHLSPTWFRDRCRIITVMLCIKCSKNI